MTPSDIRNDTFGGDDVARTQSRLQRLSLAEEYAFRAAEIVRLSKLLTEFAQALPAPTESEGGLNIDYGHMGTLNALSECLYDAVKVANTFRTEGL